MEKTLKMMKIKLRWLMALLSNLVTWPVQIIIWVYSTIHIHRNDSDESKNKKDSDAFPKTLSKCLRLLFLVWDPIEFFDLLVE